MAVSLRDLAHELDFGMGGVEVLVSRLVDVEIELSQLVAKMHEVVDTGEERMYYHEHFRKIRILTSLLRYTMDDLSRESEKTGNVRHAIFNQVVERKCENEEL